MEVLTDRTIDEMTAKYFCIFSGKDIQKYLKDINDKDKIFNTSQDLVVKQSKQLNEDATNWIKSKLSKAKSSVEDMAKDTISKTSAATTQSAIDTITNSANSQKLADTASKASAAASGAAVDSAVQKLKQNQAAFNDLAKSTSSAATQSAIDTLASNNTKLSQLSHDAGSSAAQGAIDKLASNKDVIDAAAHSAGAAATTGALSSLKTAASAAFSAATPWLIGAAVTTLGAALWPTVKGTFKKMFRTSAKAENSLAFVKFKDTDDNEWQFYFSKDKLLWKLDQMNSGDDVPKTHIQAFIETQFARAFIERCRAIIANVLDSEINFNVICQQQAKDPEGQKFMEYLAKNKESIYNRMFTGKC